MNTVEATNDSSPSAEEIYQTLFRSLRRRKGFGIVFVQCSPAQADRLIPQLQAELIQKKISVLQFTKPIDNLYNLVADRSEYKELDILFVRGLERSLISDIRSGYGGDGDYYNLSTVPPILNHLNQQRENFRDHFSNICFVFILPLFAIKYFIRRAPDFFDWSSGVFEFPAGTELERYLESKLGVSNSIQAQIERERELAREACGIDWSNSTECAAAWDAVEELQAEAVHQRTKADNGHKIFLQQYPDDKPDVLECHLYENTNNTQLLLEGDRFLKSERYDEAIDTYNKAIELKPDYHKAWNNRGIALVELGRYEEAIDSYERALEFKPDFLEALYNRGAALRNLGRYEEAIASYDMAIKTASDESSSHYAKACCYGLQGNVKGAVEALHQAIILNSECQEAAKTEADFNRVRRDSQFQALVE